QREEEQRQQRARAEVSRKLLDCLHGEKPGLVPLAYVASCAGNWSSERLIGEGAYGKVYRAVDISSDSVPFVFAVKVLSFEREEDRGALHRATEAEIKTLTRFSHPNLIRLLGFCMEEGTHALIYEYEPVGSLANILCQDGRAQRLTWLQRANVSAGLAKALNYLHKHDTSGPCYHRDVKPANIVLTATMSPKLIDCGLSRFLPEDQPQGQSRKTILGTGGLGALGTPGYMCSAYIRTNKFREASEVYSFGVTVLEIVIGQIQSEAISELLEDPETLLADYVSISKKCRDHRPVFEDGYVHIADLLTKLAASSVSHIVSKRISMTAAMRCAMEAASQAPTANEIQAMRDEVERLADEIKELRALSEEAEGRRLAAQQAAQRRCLVCYEEQVEGMACAMGHFMCKECAAGQTRGLLERLQLDESLLEEHRSHGGHMKCVDPACRETYDDSSVARALPSEIFALYRASQDTVIEHRMWMDLQAQFQEQVTHMQRQFELQEGRRSSQASAEMAAREETATAEFLRRQYPNARMCPRCRHGPVINENCYDLQAHHGEERGAGRGRISNACPGCDFFSREWSDWAPWDGVMHTGPRG
ncbi:unnamed protein product, partial [Polarella glacialis]